MQSRRTLVLIRHAHALPSYAAGVSSDALRPLSEEGRQKAAQTAQQLTQLHLPAARLLTSPLLRAVQTAQAVAEALHAPLKKTEELNGFSSDSSVVDFLREHLQDNATLVAVGHNPNISCVFHLLCGQVRPFSPGSFAVLTFDENNTLQTVNFGA